LILPLAAGRIVISGNCSLGRVVRLEIRRDRIEGIAAPVLRQWITIPVWIREISMSNSTRVRGTCHGAGPQRAVRRRHRHGVTLVGWITLVLAFSGFGSSAR
jgi:hypothetical protein